ncbi:hypothetical protein Bca4012_020274 [Brassica carinata]
MEVDNGKSLVAYTGGSSSRGNNDGEYLKRSDLDALIKLFKDNAPKQITQGEDGKEIVVVDEGKWGQEDLLVLSILHSSLDGPLMDTYSHCETPKQLWDTLQRVYGNTSNLTRIYEVKRAINNLQQEEGDFTKHLGKYSQLWSELEMLRPSSNDPETLEARREQDKVFGLFFTLSPSFNDVVRHILREKELPSYDEVCAQLQKEIGSDGLFGGGKGELSMVHKAEKVESASANKAHFKPRGGGDKSDPKSGRRESSNQPGEAGTTPLDHERGNGTESHEPVQNQGDSGQHDQEVTVEVESGAQPVGEEQRESTDSNENVTLKGANYLHWARLAKTALGGRGLWEIVEEGRPQEKTILGEDGKEVVVADAGAKKKGQEDLLVLSILQHSLDPSLQEGYSYCETSKELWDTLQKVYGNKSNLSRVFEVKRAINTLSQEDTDFDKHFGKFRSLWAELEMLRPATTNPDVLNQRREQDKVFSLLLTLHPSYGDLIKHILRNKELPSLDEVCSEIQKEQGSVGLFGGGKKDLVLANQADGTANKSSYKPEDRKVWVCDHCKKKGHGKDKCWILHPHLKPQKFKTGYNDGKANFSGDIGEPSTHSTVRQTSETYEGKGGASSSGSALRNNQDETIRRSDIEALIKLLKDNSATGRVSSSKYKSPLVTPLPSNLLDSIS